MHSLRFTWTPLTSMLTDRKLIVELKRDWKKLERPHNVTQDNVQVPYFAWGTSRSRRREDKAGEKKDDEKKENKQSPQKRRRTTKDPDNDDEPKAEFNGKLMTVDVYTMKRRFNFLHMYAGKKDPLGEAIKREAKAHRMKVTVISCEKENGVDLLAEEPYLEYLDKAKEGFWDGMHSGFPCTSFSRLRWREAKGYPGPVRSKRHPYGIPGLPKHRQQEADEGTLHASRTAHMADRIISSRPEDRLRPFATLENPPPTDHGEHLSAWELPEIANLFEKYEQDFILAEFPTCIYQPHLDFGLRTFKPQMFGGTLPGLTSLRGKCRCGDEPHVPVVGKERSAASGEYPEDLCNVYARLVIRQFQRIAKAEFFTKRQEDLRKEVNKLRKRTEEHARGRSRSARRVKQKEEDTDKVAKEEETIKTTASSKSKSKAKTKQDAEEYEYTYEYESSEEENVAGREKTKRENSPRDAKKVKSEGDRDWKGGSGKFGMLRESKAKREDPRNLNFLGGMRNPAEVVEGMPNALSLGLRIFAAWERFIKSNPSTLETAATYGTEACDFDEKALDRWRAELRKAVGAKGKMKAQLKSKWTFTSPIHGDLLEAWTTKAADPDTEVARWVTEGTPLGINRDIKNKGIFPPSDRDAEQESMVDADGQGSPGELHIGDGEQRGHEGRSGKIRTVGLLEEDRRKDGEGRVLPGHHLEVGDYHQGEAGQNQKAEADNRPEEVRGKLQSPTGRKVGAPKGGGCSGDDAHHVKNCRRRPQPQNKERCGRWRWC